MMFKMVKRGKYLRWFNLKKEIKRRSILDFWIACSGFEFEPVYNPDPQPLVGSPEITTTLLPTHHRAAPWFHILVKSQFYLFPLRQSLLSFLSFPTDHNIIVEWKSCRIALILIYDIVSLCIQCFFLQADDQFFYAFYENNRIIRM